MVFEFYNLYANFIYASKIFFSCTYHIQCILNLKWTYLVGVYWPLSDTNNYKDSNSKDAIAISTIKSYVWPLEI